ncbi:MAG: DNA-processing protein DprA [Microbacteriaceae bacterium]|nr:DNA-processing protein DprA [Microbacteriaceae bacterium]
METVLEEFGVTAEYLKAKVARVFVTVEEHDLATLAEVFSLVSLSSLVEPGDRSMGYLLREFTAEKVLALLLSGTSAGDLAQLLPEMSEADWHSALQRWAPRLKLSRVKQIFDATHNLEAKIFTPHSSYWPKQLNDLGEAAPLVLWGRGDFSLLESNKIVAIVGARASTGYGEQVTAEFASNLALRKYVVISGGAYGIDAMAHRATLNARGATIAILAGGIDQMYPSGNATLLDKVRNTGLLIAEQPPGTVPSRWRFLQRNRLIAAFSKAVLVVEAGFRSGAINTASHACHLGRELAVIPGPITSRSSDGCHRLLRELPATCVTSVEEFLNLFNSEDVFEGQDIETSAKKLSENAKRILDSLSRKRATQILGIAEASGLSMDSVSKEIFELELSGDVRRSAEGYTRN